MGYTQLSTSKLHAEFMRRIADFDGNIVRFNLIFAEN